MNRSAQALISRHVVCGGSESSIHGVVLIESGVIQDVVPISEFQAENHPGFKIEDFGNLYIMPGVIDLNVSVSEGAASVTKQAVSGGVTTIVTSDQVSGELFTDVIRLDSSCTEDSFGVKVFLDPPPENLSSVLMGNKPVFIHPLLRSSKGKTLDIQKPEVFEPSLSLSCLDNLTVTASRFTLNSDEEGSDPDTSESFSDTEPEIVVTGCANLDCKKRVSMPLVVNQEIEKLKISNSPRHFSIQNSRKRSVPIQDLPFIARGVNLQKAYSDHIANHPVDWETSAIEYIFSKQPKCPIHFCNLSSYESIKAINQYKRSFQVTCETSTPFLYFSQEDIKPGDTRYKLVPPIRDYNNFLLLWSALKKQEIDCLTSYHQPVAPPEKFIGDFFKAKNGVTSIGFNLKAVWTKLRSQIPIEDEDKFIVMLSKMLSEHPARVLKLSQKGSLCKGKQADLIIWDPDSKTRSFKTFDKFHEMSPFIGEELYGEIHKIYIRGHIASASPIGKIIINNH